MNPTEQISPTDANQFVKSIVENFRIIRMHKRITQETVAKAIGISQHAYSKIELGHTKLLLETLITIATVLDKPLTELVSPINSSKKILDVSVPDPTMPISLA